VEQSVLVVISGPPCTGKTTLGRRLASDLDLPFIHKDGIKERLLDRLGWPDRAVSRQIGTASYDLLFSFVETLLAAHGSLIAESNFQREFASQALRHMIERWHAQPIQILCSTQGDVLLRRHAARAASGERHPGHFDRDETERLREILLRGRHDPLDIPGQVIEVDTTEFDAVDYAGLAERIRVFANGEDR
jgi:predicted kinase